MSLEEDLNLSPTIQFPVNLDMEILNMFPVAELSDLNNTDLSFLDDISKPGDHQHTEVSNMTDLNSDKGSCFTEFHALSTDWLSGNIGLDTVSGEITVPQSAELNPIFSPSISNSSCVDCPAFIAESPCNTFQIDMLTDSSFFTESQRPEDRIYSSRDELGGKLTDVHHDKSPLISESEEISIDHNVKGDYSVAGKKYLMMRQKNNVASQRSRKLRKQKNQEMGERLKELERENQHLTKLAVELEKQRDALQRQLLQIVSRK